jgi:hypothetical protein
LTHRGVESYTGNSANGEDRPAHLLQVGATTAATVKMRLEPMPILQRQGAL